MSKRMSSMARLGVAAALVLVGAGSAWAADPRPTTKTLSDAEDPRMTPAEQQQTKRHEEFERQRELAKKTMRYIAPVSALDPARAKTTELRGVVERVRDGAALISTPMDPAMKALVARGGFREVKVKEAVSDMTIFNGRVVRAIRIQGADWSPFERVVGKDVIVTLQPTPTGGVTATAVRLVR